MTKGLTLLEILVAMGVFSVIALGIFGVLGVGGTNYSTNLVSLNLQRQARQGMSWLSREARQASWSWIVIAPDDANGNNRISFNTPDATGVEYYVESTVVSGKTLWQLKRIDSANRVPKIKANDINVLRFSKESSGNILDIRVQASKTVRPFGKDQTLTFPLTEKVIVRNS